MNLKKWFLISGCVGVLVAIALSSISSHWALNSTLLVALWPLSIIGLADPSKPSDKILFGIIEIGGNFFIYGIAGILLGLLFRLGGRLRADLV